jgi:hypothetical protein
LIAVSSHTRSARRDRRFGIEDRPHTLCDFLGPVLGQSIDGDTQIASLGGDENPVGVLEPASALKWTAFNRGASTLASVVLPAPGNPMMRILRAIRRTLLLE